MPVSEQLTMQMNRVAKNVDARSQSEKLLILGILLVAIILLYLSLAYDPIRAEIASYRNQIASIQGQVSAQQTSYASMLALSQEDPNKFANDRLVVVDQQQAILLDEIAALAGDLVTPNQMTSILTSVLERQAGLELLSFKNEAAKPLRATGELNSVDESANAQAGATQEQMAGQVYEHGLTIEFEGDFFNTLRYLKFLEEVSGSFFWDSVRFSQEDWPNAKVTLMIHTLSADEGFIGA